MSARLNVCNGVVGRKYLMVRDGPQFLKTLKSKIPDNLPAESGLTS